MKIRGTVVRRRLFFSPFTGGPLKNKVGVVWAKWLELELIFFNIWLDLEHFGGKHGWVPGCWDYQMVARSLQK